MPGFCQRTGELHALQKTTTIGRPEVGIVYFTSTALPGLGQAIRVQCPPLQQKMGQITF